MEINDFYSHAGRCDGVLRGIMVSHPEDIGKSDGFIFVLNCHVLLLDGGMKGCTTTKDRLLKLRESIAPNGQLRITWVVSHYHVDHIVETIECILPDSEKFEFDDIYLPPWTKLEAPYAEYGDVKYHDRLLNTISEYQPKATLHQLKFAAEGGFREFFEYAGAKVTLMPPDMDWSAEHEINDIIRKGCYGDDASPKQVATYVVNSASLWVKISYAGKRLLFTGDSMKRTSFHKDESFDRMLELWRHYFDHVDFLKWPHHGVLRDDAAAGVLSIRPKYILLTTQAETASAYTEANFPEEYKKIKFVNCALSDVYLKVSPDGEFEVQS